MIVYWRLADGLLSLTDTLVYCHLLNFYLPMASMIGEDAKTLFSTWVSVAEVPPTVAKYLIAYLALTVLPAPDSPDTIMDWLRSSLMSK